jgi:hypothetical protein
MRKRLDKLARISRFALTLVVESLKEGLIRIQMVHLLVQQQILFQDYCVAVHVAPRPISLLLLIVA